MHIVDNFDPPKPIYSDTNSFTWNQAPRSPIRLTNVSHETVTYKTFAQTLFHVKQKSIKIKKDISPCFTWNLCSILLQTFHVKHYSHYPQTPLPVFQNYQTSTNRCFMWNIFPIIRPSRKPDPREIKMIEDKNFTNDITDCVSHETLIKWLLNNFSLLSWCRIVFYQTLRFYYKLLCLVSCETYF